jgi:hypothetical protein
MKSPLVKTQNSQKAVESALRDSVPGGEYPAGLHESIMRAVNAVRRDNRTAVSGIGLFQRFAKISWLPVTGFASLAILGIWLVLHNRSEQTNPGSPSLPEISTAFTASQEMVDALPSVTVRPLSDEWDKVNQDLSRTADFLLATLP